MSQSTNPEANPVTMSYPSFVAMLIKPMAKYIDNLVHMCLGLAGELGELKAGIAKNDKANIIEELGDLIFYTQGYMNFLCESGGRLSRPHLRPHKDIASALHSLETSIGELVDITKKVWVYEGRVLDQEGATYHVVVVANALESLCWLLVNTSPRNVEEANRAKLLKRYKDGKYSNEAALARADKQPDATAANATLTTAYYKCKLCGHVHEYPEELGAIERTRTPCLKCGKSNCF